MHSSGHGKLEIFLNSSSWKRAVRGNVALLGVVSLLTDFASEMVYPLLPVFLTGLVTPAAVAVYIGVMDGLAESLSSFLKILAGRWSDRTGRRKPLILSGYGVSGFARPLIALSTAAWHVVIFRLIDRVGKGLRTAPRDALIHDTVDPDVRGAAFSFHRAMDHAGAVAGPLAATLFLWTLLGRAFWGTGGEMTPTSEEMDALRLLFAVSVIPGILCTALIWRRVREIRAPDRTPEEIMETETLPDQGRLRRLNFFLTAVTLFALGNSSDLFLVFYGLERFGLGLGHAIALWVWLHLSKVFFSLPGGRLSDLWGRGRAILSGWTVYAAVYVAVPLASNWKVLYLLLFLYGAYYGLTEGAEKAFIADTCPAVRGGGAFGLYHGLVGLSALPASIMFGLLWAWAGPETAFFTGAVLALAAMAVLVVALREKNPAD